MMMTWLAAQTVTEYRVIVIKRWNACLSRRKYKRRYCTATSVADARRVKQQYSGGLRSQGRAGPATEQYTIKFKCVVDTRQTFVMQCGVHYFCAMHAAYGRPSIILEVPIRQRITENVLKQASTCSLNLFHFLTFARVTFWTFSTEFSNLYNAG